MKKYLGPAARKQNRRKASAVARLAAYLRPSKSAMAVLRRFERGLIRESKKVRRNIKRVTKQTASRRVKYNRRVKVWLTEPGNDQCTVFLASPAFRLYLQNLNGALTTPRATQVHHVRGRRLTKQGDLLLEEKFWRPVSMTGHQWIDANRAKARELGLLAPFGEYNCWPKNNETKKNL